MSRAQSSRRKALARVSLAELETFIAVAELGSFTAAAEHLHLTQPAASNRVHRLEVALGTPLLVRNTRRVSATAEGELLLRTASPLLDQLDRALHTVADPGRAERVVVASTPYTAAMLLAPAIRDYARREPGVDVVISDRDYPEILSALGNREVDMALLSERGDGRFPVEALGSDEVVLVLPTDHPLAGRPEVSPHELAGTHLILLHQYQQLYQELATVARRVRARPPSARYVGNLSTLFGLLDSGLGIAMMTAGSARHRGATPDSVTRVAGLRLRRHYNLFRPAGVEPSPVVRRFYRHLRASLRDSCLAPPPGS